MMKSIEKLIKFFLLEKQRNYDNKAVVGGLDKILPVWEKESRNENILKELCDLVSEKVMQYESLPVDQREETILTLLDKLENYEHKETEKTENIEISQNEKTELSDNSEAVISSDAEKHFENKSPLKELYSYNEQDLKALQSPLSIINGIGPKNAKKLEKLGLYTLIDLMYYFPRRYDDYSKLKPINRIEYGDELTIIGVIKSISTRSLRNNKLNLTEAVLSDGTGFLRLTWFNQPFMAKSLPTGSKIVVSGKIDMYLGRLVINNPDWEKLESNQLHTNRIVPVYPLTSGITQKWLRKMVYDAVSFWTKRIPEFLPKQVLTDSSLMTLQIALSQIHFPDNEELLNAARRRLAFDEIFLLQIGVLKQKNEWETLTAKTFQIPDNWIQERKEELPFQLTSAQENALNDIKSDLASGKPMNRLLQGDVGSGKTIVAALTMGFIAQNGDQAAIMAPTSILAEQHYKNMLKFLTEETSNTPILKSEQIQLLIGATPDSEKKEILEKLESGEIKILIGTHALIEDPVIFNSLEMIVIDEQHRFGVHQRAKLRSKGENPHLLLMTATPIPRSLALTIYGDLDLSVIDEMPAGRLPVETQIFFPSERNRAYTLIRSHLEMGNQAFIIYPYVDKDDTENFKAAVQEHERLQNEIFTNYTIGLLHGKMKADEKESVMKSLRDKKFDALVSTSVIEVGVDIPDATVILIDGANRFGLSQLHQFRGRVGRGNKPSFCILIPENANAVENERLVAMTETTDGFVLAEKDLKQRGPGEFLGTRQSGYSELKLASLTDLQLIELARNQAKNVINSDPLLETEFNSLLKNKLEQFWKGSGDIS